jgi:hypothetical protein
MLLLVISSIDYEKYYRFFLSLLWRMHISKHRQFNAVQLGDKAETIRKYLAGETKDIHPDFCRVSIFGLAQKNGKLIRMISETFHECRENKDYYIIVINGFAYLFDFSFSNSLQLHSMLALQKSGEINIPVLKYPHSTTWLYRLAPKLALAFL